MPLSPRIGTAERQQAMDALDVHLSAGRLDPDEYGERVGRASVARTAADLEPLFVDLPAPHAGLSMTPHPMAYSDGSPRSTPAASPSSASPSSASPASASSAPAWPGPASAPARRDKRNGRAPLGGRSGEVAVAASPFVAAALFFTTVSVWDQAWLFWLLIPLVGAVVYGKDRHDD